MGDILIGTSGFSYRDWKGPFYPTDMPSKDFLSFYSRQFRTLELNFSYYRIPDPRQSERMLARTDGELVFVVKAYRGMTHEISPASLDETLDLFKKGISPFVEDGSLGGILLQFPQSFHYTPRNRVYLKALIDGLSDCPLFVEFRQKDWLKDTVYDTLRSLGVGFVCVDEPALPALIPRLALHTADTGYVRFHGRNEKNWYGTDATSRYDYCYTVEELRAWVVKLRDMAKATSKVFAFFNNHAKAQAVTNARMLINLLKEPHPS